MKLFLPTAKISLYCTSHSVKVQRPHCSEKKKIKIFFREIDFTKIKKTFKKFVKTLNMFRKSDDVVVVSVNNISTSDSSSVISEASSTVSTSSSSSTTGTTCAASPASTSSDRKRKRPRFIRIVTCQICGDDANDHDHYGGVACYSCKAFFRRKVIMKQTLKCVKNKAELMQQPCIITKENRKSCKKCRLEKCFEIGMKATWVMTDEEKDEKKRLQLAQFSNDSLSSYDERMR